MKFGVQIFILIRNIIGSYENYQAESKKNDMVSISHFFSNDSSSDECLPCDNQSLMDFQKALIHGSQDSSVASKPKNSTESNNFKYSKIGLRKSTPSFILKILDIYLKCSSNPIKVKIFETEFNSEDLKKLSEYIFKTKITSFLIYKLKFDINEENESIFERFNASIYLEKINIGSTKITLKDAQNISNILKNEITPLKSVKIKYKEISREIIDEIREGILQSKILKELNVLVNCRFSKIGEYVSELYEKSSSLESINFYYNINQGSDRIKEYHYILKKPNEETLVIDYYSQTLSSLIPILTKIVTDEYCLIRRVILMNEKIISDLKGLEEQKMFSNLLEKLNLRNIYFPRILTIENQRLINESLSYIDN